VTFIDDYSRFTWVYFLRSKSEVFSVFKSFFAYIETQFSTGIKVLRSDSGGEYMSHEFHDFFTAERYCLASFLSIYTTTKWGC
jgi:hypothetical protein